MKRKFTFLIAAAFMLLTMMATTGTMWGQTTVTQTNFTNYGGNLNNDANVSYQGYKGGGTSTPYATSGYIRLYQNSSGQTGGYIVIGVPENYYISSATIQSNQATTTGYKLTDTSPGNTTPAKNTFNVNDYSLSANTDYTVSDIESRYITFACFGTSSSSRLEVKKISITYQSSSGGTTTYTVTYDANGGSGTMTDENSPYEEGATVTVLENTFTRSYYSFENWNTASDGSGIDYDAGDEFEINANITLYAQWTAQSDIVVTTLTQSNLELTGNYSSDTEKTIDGITYIHTDLMKNNNNIQAKASTGTIKNTTAYPGNIISVAITHYGTGRATTINGSADGTNWTQVATGSGSINADFSDKGYRYFQITRGSNAAYWEKIDIVYSNSGGSSQTTSDLTITNASTDITFDLYSSATDQVINYTTSSTGAITITPETSTYFSYVHDAVNKTITVTPLVVTPSAQTVTISQAADDNYYAGTAIFTVSVANSDPDQPGSQNHPYTVAQARAAIDAGTGTQGVYATGIVSEIVTPYGTNNYLNITFNIVDQAGDQVFLQAFRCVGDDAPNVLVNDVVVVSGNLTKYGQTYEFAQGCSVVSLEHPSTPYITAEDVNITYDATAGSIAYTIQNPVQGGQVTATTTSTWLTLGTDFASPIAFTCNANEAGERTATVTLTYTYGNEQTATKDVTVTQAGNPNVFDNISDITKVGTAYSVKGTVVAINSRGFVMGDGTGYVYYYKNAAPTQAVNDMVTVAGTTGTYGQIIQFTSAATVGEATTSNYDGTPAATVITAVPDYSTGYHLSTYLEFAGALSKSNSNYFITLGEEQIQISYPTSAQSTALDALVNKTVSVKGYFSGINSSSKFTVMLESAEEVLVPSITLAQYEYNLNADGGDATLPVTYTNMPADPQAEVIFYEANGTTTATYDWITASINASYNIAGHIDVNEGEARSAYFKVRGKDANNNYVYSNLVTINQAALSVSIEFETTSMNLNAGGEQDRIISFEYQGLGSNPSFEVRHYNSTGEQQTTYNWLTTEITQGHKVNISVPINDSGAARDGYFKVYGENGEGTVNTESNLVSVHQAAYVVDYATLPFEFDGGKAAIATTTGLTQEGLGSDYTSSPKLKFDGTGDWVILKINERPGTLTYDIKGNGFSGGTFTVKTSEDGATYTDLETYTSFGSSTESEEFTNLGENVRYIKWIYTEKSNGNVALGNIALTKYVEPVATITVAPAEVNNVSADGDTPEHTVTLANMSIGSTDDFAFAYCDSEGNILGNEDPKPEWIELAETEYTLTGENTYSMIYTIAENTEETSRTGYFKISVEQQSGTVYSNLVTVTQLGYVAPVATITVDPNEVLDVPAAGDVYVHTVTLENMTVESTDDFTLAFCDENGEVLDEQAPKPDWIEIGDVEFDVTSEENVYSLTYPVAENTETTPRTAYFKVAATQTSEAVYSNLVTVTQDGYVPPVVADNYELFSGDLVEGDYLIVYDGVAMNNTLSGKRFGYDEVTITNNTISNSSNTIVWHIAPSETTGYWTLYNVEEEKYASNGGSSMDMSLSATSDNDNTLWSVTAPGETTHEFRNKNNESQSARYLRRNGTYGFACYASSTGGSLSLFKKVDNNPSITADDVIIAYDATGGSITYTINNPVEGGTMGSTPISGGDWLTVYGPSNGSVALTCDQNTGAERTATVRLTYTYNNTKEAVTKDVTVTQTGAPIPTYIVSFVVGEGGTFVPNDDFDDEMVEVEAGTYTLPSATKEGYTFDGWNYGEQTYAAGASYEVSDDVEFTATYTALPTYTVSFWVNGDIDNDLTDTGSSIDLPTTSARTPDGFAIYGWALQNSTEAVANPYVPTADVTLYAILQLENVPSVMEKYVKVTEELTDWSGEYLIAYSDYTFADGRIGGTGENGIGAQNVSVDLSSHISNNTISRSIGDSYKVTLEEISEGSKTYVLKTQDGKYNYQTSNNNGLLATENKETAASYPISVTFTSENDIKLCLGGTATGAVFRYNTSGYFRYYKNGGQNAVYLYKKVSETVTPTIVNVEYVSGITPMSTDIPETTCVVVEPGAVLTFTGVNEGTAANLVVQEGGQLIHTSPVEATIQKSISGYSKSGDGWYLIASPVDGLSTSGLITEPATSYDLFKYDEPSGWWYSNTGTNDPFTSLERGKGYLYANAAGIDLSFAGEMIGTNDEVTKTLSFACTAYPVLKGYNLMGNPFTRNLGEGNITLGGDDVTSVLLLNNDSEYQTCNFLYGDVIKPGQGFFIQATDGDKLELKFKPSSTRDANEIGLISIEAGDESYIDKAYIQFGGGNTLRKMTFSGDKSQVYVMNNGDDYAAARLDEAKGLVPVHFEAAGEGIYTITIEAKNLDLETLRLIDNFTGEEIDLLVEPTYTFKANSDEPANRFTLLFEKSTLGIDENDAENEVFAYQSGDEIYFNGEGTLQVFDVMGRFVMSREINGNDHISTSLFNTGVYVFRLVGETVMTQKIVVR